MAESNSAQYEDRGNILKIVEAIMLALAFTILGSRLYVRFRITKNPGWDDFFIVLAMVKQSKVLSSLEQLTENTRL